jgi:2-polyprenyl-3-methyl-5-hydroxy-6-metoxy-1,4-benzoquinol methylase
MTDDAPVAATCWLCGAPAVPSSPYDAVGFARCTTCGFLFQPTRASAEAEARLYDAAYFDGYDQRTGGRADGQGHYDLAVSQRASEASLRVKFVQQFSATNGSLLEIGAASGYFVAAAAAAGFTATGIEPSAPQAADARERGISVQAGTLDDIASSGEQFDVVCAWHVLEHLPVPRAAMQQVRSLVRPGGWLFLELPNVGSVAALRGGTRWAHLDPEAHVAQYTPTQVARLLEGAGLEVVELETFSIRLFSRSRARSLAHAAFDTVVLQTPALVHPTRHELIRAAARRPLHGT